MKTTAAIMGDWGGNIDGGDKRSVVDLGCFLSLFQRREREDGGGGFVKND